MNLDKTQQHQGLAPKTSIEPFPLRPCWIGRIVITVILRV